MSVLSKIMFESELSVKNEGAQVRLKQGLIFRATEMGNRKKKQSMREN